MITREQIHKLHDFSGCSRIICKRALEYGNGDWNVAIAYLKAENNALCTRGISFDDRVKMFMEDDK